MLLALFRQLEQLMLVAWPMLLLWLMLLVPLVPQGQHMLLELRILIKLHSATSLSESIMSLLLKCSLDQVIEKSKFQGEDNDISSLEGKGEPPKRYKPGLNLGNSLVITDSNNMLKLRLMLLTLLWQLVWPLLLTCC